MACGCNGGPTETESVVIGQEERPEESLLVYLLTLVSSVTR